MCAALASLTSRFLVILNEENGETCTKCLDETISATFFSCTLNQKMPDLTTKSLFFFIGLLFRLYETKLCNHNSWNHQNLQIFLEICEKLLSGLTFVVLCISTHKPRFKKMQYSRWTNSEMARTYGAPPLEMPRNVNLYTAPALVLLIMMLLSLVSRS